MATQLLVPAGPATCAEPDDLALVGEIAALMDAERLWDSLDLALRRLREHCAADAAELFLADPRGQEMFLVSHEGADVEAFCLRHRFRAGEGFPGITLRSGAAVVTTALSDDADFLRGRVKALQYHSAVCVPLRQDGAVVGCLLLAWKGRPVDVERALRLTSLAARPIGAAVEVARDRIRIRGLERRSRRNDGFAGAPDGPLPFEATSWGDATRRSGTFSFSVHAAFESAAGPAQRWRGRERCPARCTGQVQVLGGRAGWPCSCLRNGCTAKARYCIPLSQTGRVWGIATVMFRERAPVPLARHLPAALWMAEDLAPVGAPPAPATRLVIRCLGGLAVMVDGQPLGGAALSRSKARELLALLVAAGGRPRSGAQLAESLWPEATAARARNRFHVTLFALRRAIEPPGSRRWTHVRREGSSYYLDPGSSVFVDVWRFRELLRRAEGVGTIPSEEVRALLEEAVALHDGDPFDGQFASVWPDGLVRWCRDALRHALHRLAELQMAAGEPRAAAETARRAEALDPLRSPDRGRRREMPATTRHAVHAASAGRAASPRTTLRSSPTNAMSQAVSAT